MGIPAPTLPRRGVTFADPLVSASTPPRPVSFAVETPPEGPVFSLSAVARPSVVHAIREYFTRDSKLFFFTNDVTTSGCVGLVINGRKWAPANLLHDWGSNGMLITEDLACQLGIPVYPMQIRLNTSNGASTVTGVTAPLILSYGSGSNELVTEHCFLVIKSHPGQCFHALIGNPDAKTFHALHDTSTGIITYHTSHGPLHIPVSCRPPSGGA